MLTNKNSEFYDQMRKKEWKHISSFGPSIRSRYRTIVNLLSKYSTKDASIIDVGCGSGNLLNLLAQSGFHKLAGSDFSLESIKTANKKVGNIVFKADLTKIETFNHQYYDVVICSDVLEHIDADTKACKNIYDMLSYYGIAIISVPVNRKYWSAHDDFSGHVRRYEPMQLENILIQQGFIITKSHYWGSLIYSLYHALLRNSNPKKIMSAIHPNLVKKIIAKFLYYTFVIEDYFNWPSCSKRLFIVAKKTKFNSY